MVTRADLLASRFPNQCIAIVKASNSDPRVHTCENFASPGTKYCSVHDPVKVHERKMRAAMKAQRADEQRLRDYRALELGQRIINTLERHRLTRYDPYKMPEIETLLNQYQRYLNERRENADKQLKAINEHAT